MSGNSRRRWQRKDSDFLIDRLGEELDEELQQEVGEELSEDQLLKLKRDLASSLSHDMKKRATEVYRRFIRGERRLEKIVERKARKSREESVERLSLHIRLQHMILFISTVTLIVTGLPIKFHEAAVSSFLIHLMGGPQVTRIIHRIGAIGLTFIGVYHIFYTMAFKTGRRDFGLLIPKIQDVKDFFHQLGYFLGRSKDKPKFGRFSYIEKFDYWAVYWGMVVMITSGYILWFKVISINHFGKFVYDIAVEAHSDEALLATLAIVIWHFYNVHFNPKRFPGSLTWWNGKMSIEDFREEHPLEYEEMLDEGGKEQVNQGVRQTDGVGGDGES